MTTPTYYDTAFHLDQEGIAVLDVNLFAGEFGEPDSQILVLEGPATPSDLKELFENTAIQVLVRGDENEADFEVYGRAFAISDYLLTLPDCVEMNGVSYKGFEESSNIAPIGKDTKKRFIYSMNFTTTRNR